MQRIKVEINFKFIQWFNMENSGQHIVACVKKITHVILYATINIIYCIYNN